MRARPHCAASVTYKFGESGAPHGLCPLAAARHADADHNVKQYAGYYKLTTGALLPPFVSLLLFFPRGVPSVAVVTASCACTPAGKLAKNYFYWFFESRDKPVRHAPAPAPTTRPGPRGTLAGDLRRSGPRFADLGRGAACISKFGLSLPGHRPRGALDDWRARLLLGGGAVRRERCAARVSRHFRAPCNWAARGRLPPPSLRCAAQLVCVRAGPCSVTPDGSNTTNNPYSWNAHANLLYIDQVLQLHVPRERSWPTRAAR